MASAAVSIGGDHGGRPTPNEPPRIVRLWRDTVRVEQLARLNALELQAGDEYGAKVWEMAAQAHRDLPEDARIDLPSARVFGRVLGLFRTGATLKTGKLLRLEISAQEIADLVGYSKATTEACLRWLSCEPIEYQGHQVARGLGFIHRGRRTAWAFLDGVRQRIYRTSRLILTLVGRLALGLGDRSQERKKERRQQHERQHRAKRPRRDQLEVQRRELEYVQANAGADGGEDGADDDLGRRWLERIKNSIG